MIATHGRVRRPLPGATPRGHGHGVARAVFGQPRVPLLGVRSPVSAVAIRSALPPWRIRAMAAASGPAAARVRMPTPSPPQRQMDRPFGGSRAAPATRCWSREGVIAVTGLAQDETAPAPEPSVSPEELVAFIERLRRQLYAKRDEFLALLAELADDAPDR